jgi:biopolymer transport protein ExbD
MTEQSPNINVTPLIDILLVLLIIFMVISPMKPASFKAKIPAEPKSGGRPDPLTLVVSVNPDGSLLLNSQAGVGSISEPAALLARLQYLFAEREQNGAFNESLASRSDLTAAEKVEKTVFIKAPGSLRYGDVARLIDTIKLAGSNPIALQIDELN